MTTAIKKCRVCGKEYEACRSARRGDGIFRWREVACSPEHGAIYLAQVLAARESSSKQAVNLNDDDASEEDIVFTEDFEDSDEEIEIDT